MIGAYLRRGLAAGLVAGLLAGLFGFILGEPALDRAVELEKSAEDPHGTEHADEGEPFGRGEQKAGLFLAAALYGTAVGGAFGLASAYFRSRVAAEGGAR